MNTGNDLEKLYPFQETKLNVDSYLLHLQH